VTLQKNHGRNIALLVISLVGFIIIFWWLNYDPTNEFSINLEGTDNRGEGVTILQNVSIGEHFEEYSDNYTELNETWPRFRGEDIDNISKSRVKLTEKFGPEGPKILWSKNLGEGHSGAAIWKGLAYVLDYDEEERADNLRCFSLVDGEEQCGMPHACSGQGGFAARVSGTDHDDIIYLTEGWHGGVFHPSRHDNPTNGFLEGIST